MEQSKISVYMRLFWFIRSYFVKKIKIVEKMTKELEHSVANLGNSG